MGNGGLAGSRPGHWPVPHSIGHGGQPQGIMQRYTQSSDQICNSHGLTILAERPIA